MIVRKRQFGDGLIEVRKGAMIRNRYNQVPHLTQDTNLKVTNSQLDITNEIQEVNPFTAGDHKATINKRARKHDKHLTDPQKKYRLKNSVNFHFELSEVNFFMIIPEFRI